MTRGQGRLAGEEKNVVVVCDGLFRATAQCVKRKEQQRLTFGGTDRRKKCTEDEEAESDIVAVSESGVLRRGDVFSSAGGRGRWR